MSLLQDIEQKFSDEITTRHTIQELAGELWDDAEVAKLSGVKDWKDILALDVESISEFGFGGIFQFMEADMLRAYLPALLYFARSEPYPYANIVTNLVTLLDPAKKVPVVDVDRVTYLQTHLSSEQKCFLAETFTYIAERDFKRQPTLFNRAQRLASFWRES